jgi:hypothetical protein
MQAIRNDMDRRGCVVNEGGRRWMSPVSQRDVMEREAERPAWFMRENRTKSTVDATIESARTRAYRRAHAEDERPRHLKQGIARPSGEGFAKVTEANEISCKRPLGRYQNAGSCHAGEHDKSVPPIERKQWRMRYPVRDLKYLTRSACV